MESGASIWRVARRRWSCRWRKSSVNFPGRCASARSSSTMSISTPMAAASSRSSATSRIKSSRSLISPVRSRRTPMAGMPTCSWTTASPPTTTGAIRRTSSWSSSGPARRSTCVSSATEPRNHTSWCTSISRTTVTAATRPIASGCFTTAIRRRVIVTSMFIIWHPAKAGAWAASRRCLGWTGWRWKSVATCTRVGTARAIPFPSIRCTKDSAVFTPWKSVRC